MKRAAVRCHHFVFYLSMGRSFPTNGNHWCSSDADLALYETTKRPMLRIVTMNGEGQAREPLHARADIPPEAH